jgi:hypothetical protein
MELNEMKDTFFRMFNKTTVCKLWQIGEISGSHGGEYKDGCILGCGTE